MGNKFWAFTQLVYEANTPLRKYTARDSKESSDAAAPGNDTLVSLLLYFDRRDRILS